MQRVFEPNADLRNDGVVELSACAYFTDQGVNKWYDARSPTGYTLTPYAEYGPTDDPVDRYIIGHVNHQEETGVFQTTPLAVHWMRNMVCRELHERGLRCAPALPLEIPMHAPARRGEPCDPTGLLRKCSIGLRCCMINFHGVCQEPVQDWFGIQQCPMDCVGKPFGKPNTCYDADRVHTPRRQGERCLSTLECADKRGCCNGKCEDMCVTFGEQSVGDS